MSDFKRLAHPIWNCKYHIAWCPNYRLRVRNGASMSSHDTKKPRGGVNMGHVVESPDPNEHLLERIPSRENMLKARRRVKTDKGAAGIDAMPTEVSPELAHLSWDKIRTLVKFQQADERAKRSTLPWA